MSSTQPKWLGKELEYIPEQCDEIIETDVIVCGAGTAGVAAAREAAELGAQCVLFEKTAKVQAAPASSASSAASLSSAGASTTPVWPPRLSTN